MMNLTTSECVSFLEDSGFYNDYQHQQEQLPYDYDDSYRLLQETTSNSTTNSTNGTSVTTEEPVVIWEVVFSSVVLLIMIVVLVSDKIGADSVMIIVLTAFMASGIINTDEALAGFANEGVWTVMVMFVIASGISKTGAIDWYMIKLLGQPRTAASAQLRLMLPVSVLSAFMNNTPVVAIMIPITQKWSKDIRLSVQQLLIPLSYASILGGTCTLIGTSTNLVVADLYYTYSGYQIGLFDLGEFGVPVAMAGLSYILLLSPFLLPGGSRSSGGNKSKETDIPIEDDSDVLLGARLTKWSPAAGRTVLRSGLRDTGGIFLVSVRRAATGHVHRAVSHDFVLNTGDVLYFTGLIESFGDFCEEHGLEVVTNEIQIDDDENENENETNLNNINGGGSSSIITGSTTPKGSGEIIPLSSELIATDAVPQLVSNTNELPTVHESVGDGEHHEGGGNAAAAAATPTANIRQRRNVPMEVGWTKESLLQSNEDERLRSISIMADLIRGFVPPSAQDVNTELSSMSCDAAWANLHIEKQKDSGTTATTKVENPSQPQIATNNDHLSSKIVVAVEKELIVVGVNSEDRPGLLLDISKGLMRLNLELRHTEARVVGTRSISIWRCEMGTDIDDPDLEEIWSVLNALLSQETGVEAIKQRGLRVIRARVTKDSRLVNKSAVEVEFRAMYHAAIVAVQSGGGFSNATSQLSTLRFSEGDILILQASDDSPLLATPPEGFYDPPKKDGGGGLGSRKPSISKIVSPVVDLIARRRSNTDLESAATATENTPADGREAQSHSSNHASSDNGGASSSDDAFFIPSGDDDASGDDGSENVVGEAGPDLTATTSFETLALEDKQAVWRDLQVLFVEEGDDANHGKEFLMAMEVAPDAKWTGKNVREIGLHKLPDLFLVSIERPAAMGQKQHRHTIIPHPASEALSVGESSLGGTVQTERRFVAVDPGDPIQEGDVLWFSGTAAAVGDLRKIPGLISYEDDEVKKMNEKIHDRRLVQAVISRKGPLVGKTVKEVRFRTKYGAAVIAVHREGKRIHEHPGKVKLHAGDVLLLEAGPSFYAKSAQNDRSFTLLAEVENSAPPRLRLLIPALVLTVAMLAVYMAQLTPLLVSALVAAILMVFCGILSEQEARDALNWEVYMIISASYGIGTALVNSGVAGGIADLLVAIGVGLGIGQAGLFGAVYFATFLISSVVTNTAAAALMFPIAMDAALQTGADTLLMSYILMLGASASFMTPFGYQTNLMIYGPGGYKYTDFLKFGSPMQIVLWILSTVFVSVTFIGWWMSWIITGAVFLLIVVTRICNSEIAGMFRKQKASSPEQPEDPKQNEESPGEGLEDNAV